MYLPATTACSSWEHVQTLTLTLTLTLLLAAPHKAGLGSTASRKGPALWQEATSFFVDMTLVQTKTTEENLRMFCEMGGMLLQQKSTNTHFIPKSMGKWRKCPLYASACVLHERKAGICLGVGWGSLAAGS